MTPRTCKGRWRLAWFGIWNLMLSAAGMLLLAILNRCGDESFRALFLLQIVGFVTIASVTLRLVGRVHTLPRRCHLHPFAPCDAPQQIGEGYVPCPPQRIRLYQQTMKCRCLHCGHITIATVQTWEGDDFSSSAVL